MGLRWLRRWSNLVVRRAPATSASASIGSGAGNGTKTALCFPLNVKCFPQRPYVHFACITEEKLLSDFERCTRTAVRHSRWEGGGTGGTTENGQRKFPISNIRSGIFDARIPVPPRPASASLGRRGGFGSSGARFYSRIIWQDDDKKAPRLLVVQPRIHPLPTLRAKLLEALRLADSLEDTRTTYGAHEKRSPKQRVLPPYVLVQSPSSSSGRASSSSKRLQAGAYFGSGTVDIVRVHVDQAASQGRLDAVFVNAPLSGIQQRNLEKAWGKPVLDRVGLIIRIFGAHAHTRAAKLQVELASLYYNRSRLVRARGRGGARLGFGAGGDSEVVSARGRATGAIGGAGETEIQLQRRRIGDREHRLKLLLADVDRTQTLHRTARQRQGQEQRHTRNGHLSRSRLPVVAVVGYTNAGKSSLVAALARTCLYVDDKLFATLETRSRRVILPSGQKIILSDTVGFISDLPIQLVRAFQSTLDEVVEADYLLHVIDSSAPNASEQREEVLQVLENIGVPNYKLRSCLIEVWNKVDLVGESVKPFEAESNTLKQINNGDALDAAAVGQPLQGGVLTAGRSPDLDSSDSIQLWKGSSEQVLEERVELLDPQWSHEGVSCVATSVRTRTGLSELSQLLDKNLSILPIMHKSDERFENFKTEYVGDV